MRGDPSISYLLVITVLQDCVILEILFCPRTDVCIPVCTHAHTSTSQKAHLLKQLSQHPEMKPRVTRSRLLTHRETTHGPLRGHNACSVLWSGILSPSFPIKMFPYLAFKIHLLKLIFIDGEGQIRLRSLMDCPCRGSTVQSTQYPGQYPTIYFCKRYSHSGCTEYLRFY